MMRSRTIALGIGMLAAILTTAHAGGLPPSDSKPLSELVRTVESLNLGTITEAEFDNGHWEFEVHKGGRRTDIYLDPRTGNVQRTAESAEQHEAQPPLDGKPLAEIVQSVEARKLGTITEVDFDDGYWEFDIRNGALKIKLDIDPLTGEDRSR